MNSKRFNHHKRKELHVIFGNALYGISLDYIMANPTTFAGTVTGPCGSPYENGLFHVLIVLPDEYPTIPPEILFLTRIFHPNIDEQGRIRLNILNPPATDTWQSDTVKNVLLAIQELLRNPDPHRPLCSDIAKLYLNDRASFEVTARVWTMKYAQYTHLELQGDEARRNKKEEDSAMSSTGSSSFAMEWMEEDDNNNTFTTSSSLKTPWFAMEWMEEDDNNNTFTTSSSLKTPWPNDFSMDEATPCKKPRLE